MVIKEGPSKWSSPKRVEGGSGVLNDIKEHPIQAEKHPIQAEKYPIHAKECWWKLKSTLPAEECRKGAGGGGGVRSAESTIGATIQTEERLC